MRKLLPLFLLVLIYGCAMPVGTTTNVARELREEPQQQLDFSLFKSDTDVISDEAIQKVLSGEIKIPAQARVAVLKLPSRHWVFLWSEELLRMEQEYMEAVQEKVGGSSRVSKVTFLPSLMKPKEASIPQLREAAARLQSDMLLVFQVKSDIYRDYKFFSKDKAKAYSTCEALLLDVRTGIIPFTTVITREAETVQDAKDTGDEMMKRAEKKAVLASINALGEQLSDFFIKLPQ